jgi:dihydropteroate synthase
MQLFGVINASPDSLNEDSIATTPEAVRARAELLISHGAFGFDLGGQGSTFQADEVDPELEWDRLAPLIPVLAETGMPFSVDTWRPSVMRRSLQAGATWMNAADGMQTDEMWEVAAEFQCPVVLPFLSGPDPLHMDHVRGDPVDALIEFFTVALATADRYGVRHNMVLDPGTGFAPHHWPWEERYVYQKRVYSNLDALRVFGLPLYIALPWKDTEQHNELLDIVIDGNPEYGRGHYLDRITAAERQRAAATGGSASAADRPLTEGLT